MSNIFSIFSSPKFSRSGTSTGLGKCTAEIKTHVPGEVHNDYIGLAAMAGMSMSEYVREVLIVHSRGAVHAMRLHTNSAHGSVRTGRE